MYIGTVKHIQAAIVLSTIVLLLSKHAEREWGNYYKLINELELTCLSILVVHHKCRSHMLPTYYK